MRMRAPWCSVKPNIPTFQPASYPYAIHNVTTVCNGRPYTRDQIHLVVQSGLPRTSHYEDPFKASASD
jgi:hypothetical protein